MDPQLRRRIAAVAKAAGTSQERWLAEAARERLLREEAERLPALDWNDPGDRTEIRSETLALLDEIRRRSGLSNAAMARMAGVDPAYLSRLRKAAATGALNSLPGVHLPVAVWQMLAGERDLLERGTTCRCSSGWASSCSTSATAGRCAGRRQ